MDILSHLMKMHHLFPRIKWISRAKTRIGFRNCLQLSQQQKNEINSIYNDMNANAINIGNTLIDVEYRLDTLFANKSITNSTLDQLLQESASIYGKLRYVHLNAHLQTIEILSPEQIALYNKLRRYTSGDPCENIPPGHDPKLWNLHHGCN